MATSSPPPSSSPPPNPSTTSPPPTSQPNANSDPPAALSPPPVPNAPPPTTSSPSPPISPPSVALLPPPIANSPPPASPSAPPPTVSSSPPSTLPSTPPLSPPPVPLASPPPPSLPLSPPPSNPVSSPLPGGPPPVTPPPTSPTKPQSPLPPSVVPPKKSPSPPLANTPASSPPSLVPDFPSPGGSKTPPLTPPALPPKTQLPAIPSSPPTNSSRSAPFPPDTHSPPTLSPPMDSVGSTSTPSGPHTKSSSSTVTTRSRGGSATGGGGIKTGSAVAIALVLALVLLSLVGLAVWFVKKRKKPAGGYARGYILPSPYASSQMSDLSYPRSPMAPLIHQNSGSHGLIYSPPEPGMGSPKSWFTYEELSAITNGFSTQNLLGEGGFGCVYKGCLQDGRQVAVKQLKVGGGQGEREFTAEVEIISRIHHRHLVSLVGYCISENQRLLVYDYVPNNTLHFHLHGQGSPVMDWETRVKVAAGAARGIAYLHEDCKSLHDVHIFSIRMSIGVTATSNLFISFFLLIGFLSGHPRIIHRDIKSSNILLDNNFEAQVSDFGLARLAMDAWTHVTTRVMGTFGYLAPEYASTGKLTDKSDVFSFGVVLLELITGRKPVDDSQPLGDESLVEWARPLLSHTLETRDFGDLPDPRIEKNYNESEMFRMIEAAAACVRHSAAMRPRMGQVMRALESLADIDLNNGIVPGQSELINSAQQSAEIRLFRRMAFGSQNYSIDFSQSSWKSRREF